MGIIENNLVEVPNVEGDLLTHILSPNNMNLAYKRVVRNAGSGGIDGMEAKELLPYLRSHKEELVKSLADGKYRPNPVRRVEIPKDNGKKRPLGIPTVVDRLVQQSIAQVLQPLYEPQFSSSSFGFRPYRGAHQALRSAQCIINEGNRFCIDLDLEQFFDNVNRDKTGTGTVSGKKFLGYTFYFDKEGKCQLTLHPKTIEKLKLKLKKLTSRSNGMGYAQRKEALNLFIRGWVGYYKLARMKTILGRIDSWLRRRIRMCIWKSWKNPRTRIANLIKCGVPKWQAQRHGWTKGYWRAAGMPDCARAMSNSNLYRAGYRCLMDYYV